MRRGTTPVIKASIKGIELDKVQSLYFTLKQGNTILTKTLDDVTVDADNNLIEVNLSQEDTLKFADGNVQIQLRAMTKDGQAIASNIKSKPIGTILLDGEIE